MAWSCLSCSQRPTVSAACPWTLQVECSSGNCHPPGLQVCKQSLLPLLIYYQVTKQHKGEKKKKEKKRGKVFEQHCSSCSSKTLSHLDVHRLGNTHFSWSFPQKQGLPTCSAVWVSHRTHPYSTEKSVYAKNLFMFIVKAKYIYINIESSLYWA